MIPWFILCCRVTLSSHSIENSLNLKCTPVTFFTAYWIKVGNIWLFGLTDSLGKIWSFLLWKTLSCQGIWKHRLVMMLGKIQCEYNVSNNDLGFWHHLFWPLKASLLHIYHVNKLYKYQRSVAEWLRRLTNLGVITTTELLGGCGFESHSRHE